jgi:hypothetical protein
VTPQEEIKALEEEKQSLQPPVAQPKKKAATPPPTTTTTMVVTVPMPPVMEPAEPIMVTARALAEHLVAVIQQTV